MVDVYVQCHEGVDIGYGPVRWLYYCFCYSRDCRHCLVSRGLRIGCFFILSPALFYSFLYMSAPVYLFGLLKMSQISVAEARCLAVSLFRLGRKTAAVHKALLRAGLNASRRSVFSWAEHFRRTSLLRGRKPGSGRKRVITGTRLSGLLRASRSRSFSGRRWATEHNQPRETVRRTLANLGKVARVRRKTPMVTPVNKSKRLDFAKKIQGEVDQVVEAGDLHRFQILWHRSVRQTLCLG